MERAIPIATGSLAFVLSSPELIHVIIAYLKRSDIVRLSQTCRLIFDILLPTIWKDVNGAWNLLSLIKPSSSDKKKRPGNPHEMKEKPTSQPLQVIPKERSCSNIFERFDLYAPFVEILNVYRDREFLPIANRSPLTSRAKNRPLLPNLKKLCVMTTHDRPKVLDIPMWIKIFVTSTLVEVSTSIPDYCWPDDVWAMSYASAGELLDALVKSSPNVQSLELCPHQLSPDPLDPNPRRPRPHPSPKLWFDYLAELPSLRHLSVTNGSLTYLSLMAIGQLTTLESLDLHFGDFQGFGVPRDINSDLSDDATVKNAPPKFRCAAQVQIRCSAHVF